MSEPCARPANRRIARKDFASNSARAERPAAAGSTGALPVWRLRRSDRLTKTLKRHTIRFHKATSANYAGRASRARERTKGSDEPSILNEAGPGCDFVIEGA